MRYISTRGQAPELSFEEAMMTGLARDGGLYVPKDIPTLTAAEIAGMAGDSYEEIAYKVMRPFIGETFTDAEFRQLIAAAYAGFGHAARAPLVQLGPNHFLLELFHGPTLAFKDFAMQLIGQMMQAALARSGKRITIVGATSGDTGSAAIEAFRGLSNVDVFILFPHGRVSEVQRRQMTTPAEANVHALAVDGDFDDCQAALKDMFNDFAFRDEVGLAFDDESIAADERLRIRRHIGIAVSQNIVAFRSGLPGGKDRYTLVGAIRRAMIDHAIRNLRGRFDGHRAGPVSRTIVRDHNEHIRALVGLQALGQPG